MNEPERVTLKRISQATGTSVEIVDDIQSSGRLWDWILTTLEEESKAVRSLAYYLRPIALKVGSMDSVKENVAKVLEIDIPYTVSEARQIRKLLKQIGYERRVKADVT